MKGKIIKGLNETEGVTIFHAGTTVQGENIVTNGGRVLGVASLCEDTPASAQDGL